MKKLLVFSFALCALGFALPNVANALSISAQTVTNTTIPYETLSPNGTTIQFTLDGPAEVHVDVTDQASGQIVTTIDTSIAGAGAQQIFWSAYWLLGTQGGRKDGFYSLTITATNGAATDTKTVNSLVHITSLDIHNITVTPTLTADGAAAPPFTIQYLLAKPGLVSAAVYDSSNTLVKTLIHNVLQVDETVSSNTIVWNGLSEANTPLPIGIYTLAMSAFDSATLDTSFLKTSPITMSFAVGAETDPQKLFEKNVFVYPNPVRGAQGTFQMEAIRDGANLSLKIYTITGTLVYEQSFPGIPAGNIVSHQWLLTNQSGKKVGRGLYYYVVREEDSAGTLQTVKKMAVLP